MCVVLLAVVILAVFVTLAYANDEFGNENFSGDSHMWDDAAYFLAGAWNFLAPGFEQNLDDMERAITGPDKEPNSPNATSPSTTYATYQPMPGNHVPDDLLGTGTQFDQFQDASTINGVHSGNESSWPLSHEADLSNHQPADYLEWQPSYPQIDCNPTPDAFAASVTQRPVPEIHLPDNIDNNAAPYFGNVLQPNRLCLPLRFASTRSRPSSLFRRISQRDHLRPRSEPDLRQKPQLHRCTHPGCTKACSTLADLKHHRRCHISKSERKHGCDLCGQRFNYPRELNRHLPVHGSQYIVEKFYCPDQDCLYGTQGFPRKDHRNRHVKKRHPGLVDSLADTLSSGQVS